MPLIKKDIYELAQSATKTIAAVGEEIRIDLNLKPNPNLNTGTVTGTVTSTTGTPIPGAVVKIMDNDYTPLAHVVTAADGSYIFSPFAPGNNYRIFAAAAGFELATVSQFSLLENQTVVKDIEAVSNPLLLKSFIAGDITDEAGAPIYGAVIELYEVDEEGNEIIAGIAFSNEYGQYVFRELEIGDYEIRISSLGYESVITTVAVTKDTSIAKIVTTVTPDAYTSKGTVSGIITDDTGAAVVGADVVLYRVEADESLTPVAITKTIQNGAYLFVNTAQGNYKVKSSKTVVE